VPWGLNGLEPGVGGTHLSGVGAPPAEGLVAAAVGVAPNELGWVPNTLEPNTLGGFGTASAVVFAAPATVAAGAVGPVWKILGLGAPAPKTLPPLGWLSCFFTRSGFVQLLLKLKPPLAPLEVPFDVVGAPNALAAPLSEIPREL
jgi:hypothetical protein